MADGSSQESPLGSALQATKKAVSAGIKVGLDTALTAATAGTSKVVQVGLKLLGMGIDEESLKKIVLIAGGVLLLVIFLITTLVGGLINEAASKVTTTFGSSGQFLEATKTVTPNHIENSELPHTFTYTINVTAKDKGLSEVKFIQEKFTVFQKNGSRADLIPTHNPLETIDKINPGQSKITQYSITLSNKALLEDSIVVNDVIIESKVEDSLIPKKVKASAVLTIGKPTGCFTFTGPWSESEKNLELEAIAKLMIGQKFANDLCKNPLQSIELIRDNTQNGCEANSRNSQIFIRNNCLGNEENALYALAHESGHVYATRNNSTYGQFITTIVSLSGGKQLEPFLCSYPLDLDLECQKRGWKPTDGNCISLKLSEDFAETMAVFIMNQFYSSHPYPKCNNQPVNLEGEYPRHYNFIKYLR